MTITDFVSTGLAAADASAESLMLLLGAGLLIGLYHALEPDHVAAISATITGKRLDTTASKAKRIKSVGIGGATYGMMWGFGHTSAVFLVAVAVFVLAIKIPPHVFGVFEAAVGVMLVVLGASALANGAIPILSRLRLHSHAHMHEHEDGTVHSHPHEHNNGNSKLGASQQQQQQQHHKHGHRSYIIGCIHGLAGSGGLVALAASHVMTGTAVQHVDGAPLLFASVFGAGSIIGMSAVAGLLALILVIRGSAYRARQIMRYGSGTGAAILGAYIMTSSIMTAIRIV